MSVNNNISVKATGVSPVGAAVPGGGRATKPDAVVSDGDEFFAKTYAYNEQESRWEETFSIRFSPYDKMGSAQWASVVDAGLAGDVLGYMADKTLDASLYLSEKVLQDQTHFHSAGYLAVQAGDKAIILNGHSYAANIAKALNLASDDVVFSPNGGNGHAAGLNLKIDGQWIHSGNPLSAAVFGNLSDEVQWSLVYALAGKAIPDSFISQDLWNPESAFSRMSREAAGEAGDFTLDPELEAPSDVAVGNPDLSFTIGDSDFTRILRKYGMMGNADAWAMGLMFLSSNMQATLTKSLASSLEINKKYDDFLFNKSLLLNNRIFKIIREGNLEFQKAQAAMGKKRTAAERWDSIWDNVGRGDWGQAFEEGLSLAYDATIGMVTSAISWVVGKAAKELNKVVAQVTSGMVSPQTQKQIEGFIAMWDEMAASAESSMRLEKHEYGDTTLISDEEAAEKMAEFNTLSEKEAEFLNYTDISALLGMTSSTARTITDIGKGVANFIGGAQIAAVAAPTAIFGLLTAGSLALGPLAWFTITPVLASLTYTAAFFGALVAIPAAMGMMSANQVMDANVYSVEANYRQAQFSYVASMAQATMEGIAAAREAVTAEIDLVGKDVAMAMEFISGLEDLVNQVLETVAGLSRGAAEGFSS